MHAPRHHAVTPMRAPNCNGRKADRTPAEMGWPTPNAGPPAGVRWLVVGVADIDPDWVEWIPGS